MSLSTVVREIAVLITLAVVANAAFFLTPAHGESSAQNDKAQLQGQWQILSITAEDKVIKADFSTNLTIEGDRLGQASMGKYTLDTSVNPKQITVQDEEGTLTYRGIYSLTGDSLTVCINGNGKDDRRPEEFVTKKGMPIVLLKLKKVPAAN